MHVTPARTSISSIIQHNALARPLALAAVGQAELNWSAFLDAVRDYAARLKALGLEPGGRVATWSSNRLDLLIAFHAIPWAGGVVVPINTRLTDVEARYWIEDSGSRFVLADGEYLARAAALSAAPTAGWQVEPLSCPAAPAAHEAPRERAPCEDFGRGGHDLLGIFYTGGTTGRPKGVMVTHEALCLTASAILSSSGLRDDSRYLHCAPMFHLADGILSTAASLAGASHCFLERFAPETFWQCVSDQKITETIMVPTMIAMLLSSPPAPDHDLSTWRTLIYGGSPIAAATLEHMRDLCPRLSFVQYYAQTEALVMTALCARDHDRDADNKLLRSAGRPLDHVKLEIVDEAGNSVGPNDVGEIAVTSPTRMLGYWENEQATQQAVRAGRLHTGDAGYIDWQGYLFIVDRIKDMIISGGENIFSGEVEDALARHPDVAECAVIGIPHDTWGETVHAVVVHRADSPISAEELLTHCKALIAGYKCPRSFDLRVEPLPKSGAGKILKADLRAPYWSAQGRSVA